MIAHGSHQARQAAMTLPKIRAHHHLQLVSITRLFFSSIFYPPSLLPLPQPLHFFHRNQLVQVVLVDQVVQVVQVDQVVQVVQDVHSVHLHLLDLLDLLDLDILYTQW